MRQTLFYIPLELYGYPLFGWGILLVAWAALGVVMLAWLLRRHGLSSETISYLPLLALVGVVIVVVLPAIAEPQGLPVRGYGVMLLVALLAALGLAQIRARRRGLDPDLVQTLGLWLILAGIVGARLFYVVEYREQFFHGDWREILVSVINLSQGGLVVYGAIFGGAAALAMFAWWHRLPGLALADLVAPSVMLGVAFGRLGCLLNGCCFGGVCDLPWAVRFPFGSPAYLREVQRLDIYLHGLKLVAGPGGEALVVAVERDSGAAASGVRPRQRILEVNGHPTADLVEVQNRLLAISQPGQDISLVTDDSPQPKTWTLTASETSLPVHPTQIYSALDGLIICLFLLAYDPFKRRDGQLLAMVATIYPITRFLIEILRSDEAAVLGTGLTISQNISLGVLAGAILFWGYLLLRPPSLAWPVRTGRSVARI